MLRSARAPKTQADRYSLLLEHQQVHVMLSLMSEIIETVSLPEKIWIFCEEYCSLPALFQIAPCGIEGLPLIGINSLRSAAPLKDDPSRRLGTVSTEYLYKVRSRAALTLTSAYPSNQHKTATYKTWGSLLRSSDHTALHSRVMGRLIHQKKAPQAYTW